MSVIKSWQTCVCYTGLAKSVKHLNVMMQNGLYINFKDVVLIVLHDCSIEVWLDLYNF